MTTVLFIWALTATVLLAVVWIRLNDANKRTTVEVNRADYADLLKTKAAIKAGINSRVFASTYIRWLMISGLKTVPNIDEQDHLYAKETLGRLQNYYHRTDHDDLVEAFISDLEHTKREMH